MSDDESVPSLLSLFTKLQAVLGEDDLLVLKALSKLLHRNGVDSGIKGYVQLLSFFGMDARFLEVMLEHEVENTRDAFSLFRETTAISLIMSTYMGIVGQSYLKQALGPSLQKVLMCEVPVDDHVTLVSLCDEIFLSLRSLLDEMPAEIFRVCVTLLAAAKKQFPNDEYTALVGLLFLRFICPAIAAPAQYGTVESETALSLEPLRSFALISKMILMSGTGARFNKTTSCADLNQHLSRYVAEALSLLSLIIKRGQELTELGNTSSWTLYSSPHLVTIYCDDLQFEVPIFPHSTARDMRELLLRLLCSQTLDKEKLDALRFKYQRYLLFLVNESEQWNVLKFVSAISSGKEDEHPLLLDDSDTIEYFEKTDYALFFLHLDEPYLTTVKEEKARVQSLQSHIKVAVGTQSMSVRVGAAARTHEVLRVVKQKLCVSTFGTADPENMEKIKRNFQNYGLFVEDPVTGQEMLLEQNDFVLCIPTYRAPPAPITFRSLEDADAHEDHTLQDVVVRVRSSKGARSFTVHSRTSCVQIMNKALEKSAKEQFGSSKGVKALVKVFGGFHSKWLYWRESDLVISHTAARSARTPRAGRRESLGTARRDGSGGSGRRESLGSARRESSGGGGSKSHEREVAKAEGRSSKGRKSFSLLRRRKKAKDQWTPCPLEMVLPAGGVDLEWREVSRKELPEVREMIRRYIYASTVERNCVCTGGELQANASSLLEGGDDDDEEHEEPGTHKDLPTAVPMILDVRQELYSGLVESMRDIVTAFTEHEFEIVRIALEPYGVTLEDFNSWISFHQSPVQLAEDEEAAVPDDEDGSGAAQAYSEEQLEAMKKLVMFRSAIADIEKACALVTTQKPTYASTVASPTDLEHGWTPLHVACNGADVDVIEMILQGTRDVNVQNDDGTCALHYFAAARYPRTIRERVDALLHEFIRKGADLNCRNRFNETPLHRAIYMRRADMVRSLLNAGADPNACTVKMSALEIAVQIGSRTIIQLLLEAGATYTAAQAEKMLKQSKGKLVVFLEQAFACAEAEEGEGEDGVTLKLNAAKFEWDDMSESYVSDAEG